MLRDDVGKGDDSAVRNDVDNDDEEDGGYVEVEFDVVNLGDVDDVFDEVLVVVDVYAVAVADLLNDEIVEVDVADS